MKTNQAVLHTVSVGDVPMTDKVDKHVKLNEVTLPDGTKMTFYTRKSDAPKLDEVMKEIYNLASESIVRKLSK